jgi:hypothetical protein
VELAPGQTHLDQKICRRGGFSRQSFGSGTVRRLKPPLPFIVRWCDHRPRDDCVNRGTATVIGPNRPSRESRSRSSDRPQLLATSHTPWLRGGNRTPMTIVYINKQYNQTETTQNQHIPSSSITIAAYIYTKRAKGFIILLPFLLWTA